MPAGFPVITPRPVPNFAIITPEEVDEFLSDLAMACEGVASIHGQPVRSVTTMLCPAFDGVQLTEQADLVFILGGEESSSVDYLSKIQALLTDALAERWSKVAFTGAQPRGYITKGRTPVEVTTVTRQRCGDKPLALNPPASAHEALDQFHVTVKPSKSSLNA